VILADTSVWVAHFRSGEAALAALLDANLILTHPFVIGEPGEKDRNSRNPLEAFRNSYSTEVSRNSS